MPTVRTPRRFMPLESFQEGEPGEKMQTLIDTLDQAMTSIDAVAEYLVTATA